MTTTYNPETVPVEESKRLLASEIKIEIASEQDAHKIVLLTNPLTNAALTSQPG
jgi:hypothetical protein